MVLTKKELRTITGLFCIEQTFGLSTTQFFVNIIRYGEGWAFFLPLVWSLTYTGALLQVYV